ncbi:methylmalonyl-CoA epimerase [Candidatus Koribacter versatilis Ellin345]|uniref:Methylmalonyl-CoA epimerase n=1 Tax=Koribacter versatilis (strain Ellin345) TaxID=204669 RepID=Q1IIJ8_KORVE|nr:VOC family protein [Candidatus Koribacter versatilis]ABF43302.1 methylmalonyl-CoA epimerase [Candidatus Koribacter versatilis Ellin345]
MSEITAIGQIAINMKDAARATAFYRDVLCLKHLFSAGNLVFFDCGGIRLMLDIAEKPEFDHPSSIIYFKVPDLRSTYERMKTSGAKFEDEPHMIARMPDHELWMCFFRDTEGNLLSLMSEVR